MRKNSKLRIFKLILVSIIFIFSSCNNKNSSDDFFLGGEIINPSSNYVNFYYNNIKIDSLELDSGRFKIRASSFFLNTLETRKNINIYYCF